MARDSFRERTKPTCSHMLPPHNRVVTRRSQLVRPHPLRRVHVLTACSRRRRPPLPWRWAGRLWRRWWPSAEHIEPAADVNLAAAAVLTYSALRERLTLSESLGRRIGLTKSLEHGHVNERRMRPNAGLDARYRIVQAALVLLGGRRRQRGAIMGAIMRLARVEDTAMLGQGRLLRDARAVQRLRRNWRRCRWRG